MTTSERENESEKKKEPQIPRLNYNRKVYTFVIYLHFSDSYGTMYGDQQVTTQPSTAWNLDGQ